MQISQFSIQVIDFILNESYPMVVEHIRNHHLNFMILFCVQIYPNWKLFEYFGRILQTILSTKRRTKKKKITNHVRSDIGEILSYLTWLLISMWSERHVRIDNHLFCQDIEINHNLDTSMFTLTSYFFCWGIK